MAAMNWLAAQLAWERRLSELRSPSARATSLPTDRGGQTGEQPQAA